MTAEQFSDCFQTVFDAVSADGRGARLFGEQNMSVLTEAVKYGCLPCPEPFMYLEFPLNSQPFLDILMGGNNWSLRKQQYYADKNRWQNMPFGKVFRFFTDNFTRNFAYGTTWDLSSTPGQLPQPGFYTDNLSSEWVIHGTLECLGRKDSIADVDSRLQRTPDGWHKYYLGMMPQRADSPIRFGWTISQEQTTAYHEHPELLKKDLQQIGYLDFDGEMLQEVCHAAYTGIGVELQLDLFPDGSWGPCLGMGYSPFLKVTKKPSPELETPKTRTFFNHLQELGLADNRWELLKQCFCRKNCYSFADGGLTRACMDCRPSFAKVKWYHCQPAQAKYYLEIFAAEY